MTIKLALITDEKIGLLESMIEQIKEKLPPGAKIVTLSYADAKNVSVGYQSDFEKIMAEESDHEVVVVDGICKMAYEHQAKEIRDHLLKLVEQPFASLSKQRESWQDRRRTPWRKRR